jgi:hypothetical protein
VTLKCKLGELDALYNLRSGSDAQVRLMIELLDSANTTGKLVPTLVRAAVRIAEFGRTLWLDTTRLTSASSLADQPGGVFEYLDNRIESALVDAYGLLATELVGIVPVVSVDASDEELRRIRLLMEHKERDMAIRIHRSVTPAQELVDRIRRVVRLTDVPDGHVHAVLDVGFVEAVRAEHVNAVTRSATILSELLGSESTTLLSGSIPAKRTSYVTTERARPEVSLWNAVSRAARMKSATATTA